MDEESASRKCIHELKACLHRWEEESDLEQEEIMNCVSEAIDEYYDEEVIDFEPDEEMDLGEAEEGG